MKILGKIVHFIFYIFIIYILIIKCWYLADLVPPVVSVAGTIVILCLTLMLLKNWKKIHASIYILYDRYLHPLAYEKMLFLIILCSIISKLILTLILQITSIASHGDIQVYVETAKELAVEGIAHKYAEYCMSYSHMFWFAKFLSPVVAIWGESQIVLSVYIAIVSTISLVLVYDLITFTCDKDKAFLTSMVLCCLPSQLLLNQYITHEHALLLFLLLSLWLYFRVIPACKNIIVKIICFLIATLSLLAAFLMNTAGLVMIIAFIMLFLMEIFKKLNLKNIILGMLKSSCIIITILIGSQLAAEYQISNSKISEDYVQGDKVLWTLYVGANAESNAHWNFEDTESFSAYPDNATYEEIQSFRMNVLLERYEDLLRHPNKLFCLVKEKSKTIWSYFSYAISFTNETVKNQELQVIYNKLFKPLVLIEYSISLLGAIWCFCSLVHIWKKYSYNNMYLIIELYLMGTTAMLLLTECNNKYTLAMQPFFWMACYCTSISTSEESEK